MSSPSLPPASWRPPAGPGLALLLAALLAGACGDGGGPADPGPGDVTDAGDPGGGDRGDLPDGGDARDATDPGNPPDAGSDPGDDAPPADAPDDPAGDPAGDPGPDAPPPPSFRALDLSRPGDVLAGATGPDGTAWLAGAGGLVLRGVGDDFLPLEPPPVEGDLRGISAAGDAVFVASSSGAVARWRPGAGWTVLRASGPAPLNAVAALSADAFWAVGDGGTVVRGTAEGVADDPTGITYDLYGVAASEAGGVRAVGRYGTLLEKGAAAWVRTTIGASSASLRAIWRGPDGRMVAVGDRGVVVRHDGVSWKQQVTNDPEDPGRDLHAVLGLAPDDVVAAGSGGVLVRYDGQRWSVMTVAGPYHLRADLRALVAPSVPGGAPALVAAGLGSAALQRDGDAWADRALGVTGALNGVDAEADGTVVAVGQGGLVLRGIPPRLGAARLAMEGDLRAVALPWAVGDGGMLALVSGPEPGAVASGTDEDLADVFTDGDAALLAGRQGALLEVAGGAPVLVATRFPGLRAVCRDRGVTFLAGDNGRMEVDDGEGFRTVPTGTSSTIWDLLPVAGGALAAGDFGLVLSCTPAGCTRAWEDPGTFLYGLGSDGADLLAVGWAGTVLRQAPGRPWERLDPGTLRVFRAVAGMPGGGAVLAGPDGAFVLYGPAAEALP